MNPHDEYQRRVNAGERITWQEFLKTLPEYDAPITAWQRVFTFWTLLILCLVSVAGYTIFLAIKG